MIFWSFKVNAAIAGLGIPPTTFDGQLRSHVQTLGQKAKLTPQETALVLVALVMGIGAPTDLELFVSVWHHDGKVDYEKPEVIDALYDIGCPVADPHWEHDAINLLRGTTDKEDHEKIEEYAKSPIGQIFAQSRWNKLRTASELSN